VECIGIGCGDVTAQLNINRGTVIYNRASQVWQQTVVVTNAGCTSLTNLVYRVESLAPGWTLTNASGVSLSGVPYMTLTPLASLAKTTITLQFSHTGTTALSYITQVDGVTPPTTSN
jgi:hypothetical protein